MNFAIIRLICIELMLTISLKMKIIRDKSVKHYQMCKVEEKNAIKISFTLL
jgi:hypothetical protein